MNDLLFFVVLAALGALFVWALDDSWKRAERRGNMELAEMILDAAYDAHHHTLADGLCHPKLCKQERHPKVLTRSNGIST